MADADRIAAALRYQQELDAAQRPATMNPNIAAQGVKARANMTPPKSVMDPRYPAWKKSQDDADAFMTAADLVGSAIPLAGPAVKGAAALGRYAGPELARGLESYAGRTGMQLGMIETPLGRIPENSTDIEKLSDMFQNAGRRAGYELSVDRSAISPSTYLSYFKEGLEPFSLRLSNHADKHASGAFKVDPTASTFEQAMAAAKEAGYPTSLNARFENQAAKQLSIRQQQAAIEKQSRESTFNDFRDKLPKYEGARLDREANSYAVYPDSGGVIRVLKKNVPIEIKTNPNSQLIVDYILRDK